MARELYVPPAAEAPEKLGGFPLAKPARERVKAPVMNGRARKRAARAVCWATAAVLAACAGCVEREMKITSEPEGALVVVSDREVGRTPVTMSFTWYGDYDIALSREGYQTLRTHAEINPPWYEVPPLDLLSYLAPWTYRDHRFLHYRLEKEKPLSDTELVRQAEEMRRRTLAGEEKKPK